MGLRQTASTRIDDEDEIVLEQVERGASASERSGVNFDRLGCDEAVRGVSGCRYDLQIERNRFLCLAGCAHPRAERRRMGRRFVMGMVRGMRHRLGIHHPAQDEQAGD